MEAMRGGERPHLGEAVRARAVVAAVLVVALLAATAGSLPAAAWAQDAPGGAQGGSQVGAQAVETEQRLEALTRAIEAEGDRKRTERIASGVTGLVGGGAMLVGGILIYDECGEGGLSGLCKVGGFMLGAFGAGAMLGGTVALLWKRGNERAAERFMEDRARMDPALMVGRGEATLQEMADQARSDRYWRGGSWLAVGTLFGLSAVFGADSGDSGGGASIASGAIFFALVGGWGIAELFWPDAVERDWDRYRDQYQTNSLSDGDLWRRVYVAPVMSPPDTPGGFTGLQAGFVF